MYKIVLIEDDIILAENTKTILEIHGFDCSVANKGQLGIELVQSISPDIVVCDIMLDEIDGFEVLNQIRALEQFIHLPFIFLTARADFMDKRRGMNSGADDFLTKPFMAKDLVETINSRLTISSQKKVSVVNEIKKNAVDIFFSVSSKEYLNPLDSIVNLSDTAINQLNNEQYANLNTLLTEINNEGRRVLNTTHKLRWYNQLANNINPWAKPVNRGMINIRDIQNTVLAELRQRFTKKVIIDFKSNLNTLNGYDEKWIKFLFTELYQNLFQYVDISYKAYSDTRLENDKFVLILRNHYQGNYAFETDDITPFFQANRRSNEMENIGLGLYIIKQWVDSINGTFKVEANNNLFEVVIKIPVSIV